MVTEDEILKVAREAAISLLGRRDIGQAFVMQGPSYLALKAAEAGARAMKAACEAAGAKPVATVRVTHAGFGMELSTHVAYALPEGSHNLYAHPPAPAVKVKALEWVDSPVSDRWARFSAETIIGSYEVVEWSNGGFAWSDPYGKEHDAGSMPEAKAAAQADYERRIRSALAEDAEAADDDAGQSLWRQTLDQERIQPTPAPASDDLVNRLDAPTPFYGWKDPENYTPVMIPPDPLRTEASARITSDAATIASLRAEVEGLNSLVACGSRAARLAEAECDALKAEVARKDAALIRAERKLDAYVGVCTGDKELVNTVLPMVRAAISTTSKEG